MMKYISVAIDGPSGAGKSTVARAAAAKLGYVYVDTGAMYRSIGLAVCRRGIAGEDTTGIIATLPEIAIQLTYQDGAQHVLLNGEDVSEAIRTPEISYYASKVSAVPEVRRFLLETQRNMAKNGNILMDGRDIGTVILPDAPVKIFLTASAQSRAERRYKELIEKGQQVTMDGILHDINERDRQDMTRAVAPLKQADDAVLLDTSSLTLEESIAAVLRIIREKNGGKGMKFKYHRWFQALVVPLVALAFHIFFGYRVIGRENIPEGGCVVCPNHVQLSDPPFAAVALGGKTPIRLMAKKELFRKKIFAWLIAPLGAFPIDREGADITAIKTALGSVRAGQKLIIFPQGTRHAAEGETKKGAAMLAVKTRAPILPMYITEGKRFRCRATVVIGKPFTPDPKQKDYGLIADDILRRIYALKEQV